MATSVCRRENGMNALSIANYIVNNWSDKIEITNLKLNKLVYYSYVESLRKLGRPLFDDAIEAWQYGPVEPVVYQAFSSYGRNPIQATSGPAELDAASKQIVHCVMRKLGSLSAFDLVTMSHKPDGAWASVYSSEKDNAITPEAILASADGIDDSKLVTIGQAVQSTIASMPNALRLLENS